MTKAKQTVTNQSQINQSQISRQMDLPFTPQISNQIIPIDEVWNTLSLQQKHDLFQHSVKICLSLLQFHHREKDLKGGRSE